MAFIDGDAEDGEFLEGDDREEWEGEDCEARPDEADIGKEGDAEGERDRGGGGDDYWVREEN